MEDLLAKISTERDHSAGLTEPVLLAGHNLPESGKLTPGAPWWVTLEMRPDGSTQVRWSGNASVECRTYDTSQDAEAVRTFEQLVKMRPAARSS